MRVLVHGSRGWTDREAIRQESAKLPTASVIIHGDNAYDPDGRALWGKPDHLTVRKADKLAGFIAAEFGCIVERVQARDRAATRQ